MATTDAEASKMLYGDDVALKPAFEAHDADVANVLGLSAEQRQQRETEHLGLVKELGVSGYGLGALLYKAKTQAEIAGARGTADPDQSELVTRYEATRASLANQYGRDAAEGLIARAQKFVKAHPKLQQVLDTGRIGSRPDIVEALVQHVRDIDYR